jgi:hypothetical protein
VYPPQADELVEEIVDNLKDGLEQFRGILEVLNGEG